MKVKIALKFRGREMAHTEVGFAVINKFLADIAAYGHPDFPPKLIGRGINVMISPLPRNKRGKNPSQKENGQVTAAENIHHEDSAPVPVKKPKPENSIASKTVPAAFGNNAFAKLDLAVRQDSAPRSQG
jgi:translation initiation factor IF-3